MQPTGSIFEICHVVTDLDAAIDHWIAAYGAGPFFSAEMTFPEGHRYRGEPALLSMRVAFGFSGGVLIELVQPLAGDRSVFSEVLQSRGPGFHHVMLREDFDTGCARMAALGFPLALESTTPLGERCALFDTGPVNGGFTELMDLHIAFGRLTDAMAAAHDGWKGVDPHRPLAPLFAGLMESTH